MNKKTALVLGAVVVAFLGVIGLTVYFLQSQQDVRSRASEEQAPAVVQQTSCPIPAQVQNVQVEFPNCVGDICNFTQASCSWSSVAGATKYQLKVSQVESGETVRDEQVEAAVTRVEFPIVQNKTYKCEVSAINACGASGIAGSHALLCAVDALVSTPTPAPPKPTSTLIPTSAPTPTLIPTATPIPTIAPPGTFDTTLTLGIGTTVLLLLGGLLLIW